MSGPKHFLCRRRTVLRMSCFWLSSVTVRTAYNLFFAFCVYVFRLKDILEQTPLRTGRFVFSSSRLFTAIFLVRLLCRLGVSCLTCTLSSVVHAEGCRLHQSFYLRQTFWEMALQGMADMKLLLIVWFKIPRSPSVNRDIEHACHARFHSHYGNAKMS